MSERGMRLFGRQTFPVCPGPKTNKTAPIKHENKRNVLRIWLNVWWSPRSNSTKQGGQTVKCLATKQCLMVFVHSHSHSHNNFSWITLSKGERCNKVNPMWSTNPWNKGRPQHRELRVLLFSISVWVLYLTSPANHLILKMQETGRTVYSPYREVLNV